jgi:hypothetical protein
MLFYLTTLDLVKFLTEKTSKLSNKEFDPTTMTVMDA